jgi:hypothetical protein
VSHERAGKIDLGADRQDLVRRTRDRLQNADELAIAREREERRRRETKTQLGDSEGCRRPEISRWGLGGHDCHNPQ